MSAAFQSPDRFQHSLRQTAVVLCAHSGIVLNRRCLGCEREGDPTPAPSFDAEGAELDGRPLWASAEVLAGWQWTCALCGFVHSSLDGVRRLVARGDLKAAASEALRAAWVAEDLAPGQAPACRDAAAWLMRRLGGLDLVAADLLRRNGRHVAAVGLAGQVQSQSTEPLIRALARLQLSLASAGDCDRHSMVELFDGAAAGVS